MGQPVRVVGRPVEGIDQPAVGRRLPAAAPRVGPAGSLFAEETVVGERGAQPSGDQRFRALVRLGDEVDRALEADVVGLAEALAQIGAGLAAGLDGNRKEAVARHRPPASTATRRAGTLFTSSSSALPSGDRQPRTTTEASATMVEGSC